MTAKELALKAAELWPDVYKWNGVNRVDVKMKYDSLNRGLWVDWHEDSISLDALAPVERMLRENGWRLGISNTLETFGVSLHHHQNMVAKWVHATNTDEGCARLEAAIKAWEATNEKAK